MSFSLELSPDLIHVRDWVHEFAADVIRPAAAEWDEREETPWPIIQEAAKVGLYSMELFAEQVAEPSGPGHARRLRGDVLGRRRHRAVDPRHRPGRGVAGRQRHPEQVGEWLPQMFGTVDEPKVASFCSSEPGAGSDVGADPDPRALRRGHRRVGPQRHQDLGHQRRHRQRAHRGRLGAPRPRHPRAGDVHHPAGHTRASARARSSSSTASAPRTPPRWCSRTSAFPAA